MDKLINEIVSSLVPALPYLAIAGKKMSEEVGQTIGKVAIEKAKKLWEILHYRIELNPPAVQAAKKLAETPDDQNAQKNLSVELKKILEKDGDLTKQLSSLLQHGNQQQNINNTNATIGTQLNIQNVNELKLNS